MIDQIESMEAAAEITYNQKIQPDGRFECDCGRLFDPDKEGGMLSPNPYCMPVCGKCFGPPIQKHGGIDGELIKQLNEEQHTEFQYELEKERSYE